MIYVHVQSPTPENSASDEDDNLEPDDYDDDSDPAEFVPRERARPTRNRMVYYRTPRVDTSPTSNGQGNSNNGETTNDHSGSSSSAPQSDQGWHPVVTPVQDLLSGINPSRVGTVDQQLFWGMEVFTLQVVRLHQALHLQVLLLQEPAAVMVAVAAAAVELQQQ